MMPSSWVVGGTEPPEWKRFGEVLAGAPWVVSGPMTGPPRRVGTRRKGPLQAHALRGTRQEGVGDSPTPPPCPVDCLGSPCPILGSFPLLP